MQLICFHELIMIFPHFVLAETQVKRLNVEVLCSFVIFHCDLVDD